MILKKSFFSTVPRKSILIFMLGVFLLFAAIAFALDMSVMGRQSMPRMVLSVVFFGLFAIFYAAGGFGLRNQSWKAMIPIFLIQFLTMATLNSRFPLQGPFRSLDPSQVAWLQARLNNDLLGVVLGMGLGYACFVYASIIEGRRYFRVHTEMALAHEIHQVLVPSIDTQLGGFEFYGRSLPSGEVGGDLIDLAGTDEKWVAYLADVSGHGVAPGVVMGMVKSASRMLLRTGEGSELLMPRLNEVLYPLKNPDMFVTFCFVTAKAGRLRVGLAGHPSILQYSIGSQEVTEIPCPNLPLGILPEGEFSTSEVTAERGTLFALYTDGFFEVANQAGEEFGIKRLQIELQKSAREPLETIYRTLRSSVTHYGAQFDDQSILLIRKL